MPTSNETRVRVDGFWKIIPSVRPGRRAWASRRLCASFRAPARSSAVTSSPRDQSPTRVKSRPFSWFGTAGTGTGGDATASVGLTILRLRVRPSGHPRGRELGGVRGRRAHGERRRERKHEVSEDRRYRYERHFGTYSRTIGLPQG